MTTHADRVFRTPEQLSDDSEILGIKAKDWDNALVGNMAEELQVLKEQVFKVPQPMHDDAPSGIEGVSAGQLFDVLTGDVGETLQNQAQRRAEIDTAEEGLKQPD